MLTQQLAQTPGLYCSWQHADVAAEHQLESASRTQSVMYHMLQVTIYWQISFYLPWLCKQVKSTRAENLAVCNRYKHPDSLLIRDRPCTQPPWIPDLQMFIQVYATDLPAWHSLVKPWHQYDHIAHVSLHLCNWMSLWYLYHQSCNEATIYILLNNKGHSEELACNICCTYINWYRHM